MSNTNTGADAPVQHTAAEMKQIYADHHPDQMAQFEQAMDAVKQLRDITKSAARTINSLNKETVVGYLQNPNRNEANLRNASWYLLSRSQTYQRIIMYYSTMFCLDSRIVVPDTDLINGDDDQKMLKSYAETLQAMKPWGIESEFLKVIITCFIQDVGYFVSYYDDTGLFLLPLPADQCRIYGQYDERKSCDFAFAMNMRYFTSNQEYIQWWGEPFQSMWNEYQSSGENWQLVPPEYSCCLKYRSYDHSTIIPPLSGIFGSLIDLLDAEDVQAVSTQQDIFKLIYVKLKTMTNATGANQWQINPELVGEYFSRLITEALPAYCSAAMVPGNDDLGVIDFSSNEKTGQVNRVLNATKNVLNSSGGAQILNSSEVSGSTAYKYTILSDTEFAIATLLPQIQGWFNRIMPNVVSDPSWVKFFHVGRYNREDVRKEMLENAQYSLSTKLSVMALSGFDPLESLALNHLEENVLHLDEKFSHPLNSSYTNTGNSGGAPTKDVTDLGDEGEKSRDNNQ